MKRGNVSRWTIAALLLVPALLTAILNSCKKETAVFEIVGQQVLPLTTGKFDEVVIEISYELVQIGTALNEDQHAAQNLFATSPAPPKTINHIVAISIKCLEEWDLTHPANTELNGLFAISNNQNQLVSTLTPPLFLDNGPKIYISPTVPPSKDRNFNLIIQTTLDNTRILTSTVQVEIHQ